MKVSKIKTKNWETHTKFKLTFSKPETEKKLCDAILDHGGMLISTKAYWTSKSWFSSNVLIKVIVLIPNEQALRFSNWVVKKMYNEN